jgi:hypothetical protein
MTLFGVLSILKQIGVWLDILTQLFCQAGSHHLLWCQTSYLADFCKTSMAISEKTRFVTPNLYFKFDIGIVKYTVAIKKNPSTKLKQNEPP